MNWKHAVSTALAVSLVAGIASTASAQLLASDSYVTGVNPAAGEYQLAGGTLTPPNALRNQPATLVNTGFVNGPYVGAGTGTVSSANWTATAGGLVNAGLGATGAGSGKVNWGSAGSDGLVRSVARGLNGVTDSSTYWITSLVNRSALATTPTANIPTAESYVLTGFGNNVVPTLSAGSSSILSGLFVGFSGANGDLVIRYRDANVTNTVVDRRLLEGITTTTTGLTYSVIMKLSVNSSGSTDGVNFWVNATDLTDETTLTTSSLASGSFNSFALFSGTSGVNGGFSQLSYHARNWSSNAFFDEARLGTTLASVSPAVVAVPEPGTFALLGIGGVALLGIVRRRRAA